MKISEHAEHSEKNCGIRAEDIHKWIDGYFDRESFESFLEYGRTADYDPYVHRQFRHCREALPEAVKEFSDKYTEQQIRCVFECHLRDDYGGYIPERKDFTSGAFKEKYHEAGTAPERILTRTELEKYFRGIQYGSADASRGRKRFADRFGPKIILPAAAAMALFIAVVFLFIMPLFRESLMEEKREMLREITSVAVSILDYYRGLEEGSVLSGEEARAEAVREIVKLRYGPQRDNYFWITDMQPVMIMHPWRPDLVGKDLTNYSDTMNRSGKRLFVESVRLVERSGGGFLEYMWQLNAEGSRVVPKLSHVRGFEPWGWIIGTGIYVHDVEDEITGLTRSLVIILLIISGGLALFLLYLIFQSLAIERY